MSDDSIKKMASLLRSGATMLDKYCPKCGKILFKIENGTIYCPVCEMEVIIQKENVKKNEMNSNLPSFNNSASEMKSIMEINNVFLEKLNILTDQIRSTEDIFQLEKRLDIAEKILRILKIIREIQR